MYRSSHARPGDNHLADYSRVVINSALSLCAMLPRPRFAWGRDQPPIERWNRDHPNRFCNFVRSCPEGRRRCLAADAELVEAARRCLRPRIRRCHAGLLDAVVPIVSEETFLGYMIGGAVLLGEPGSLRREKVLHRVADLPLDRDRLEQAVLYIPTMSAEMARHSIGLLWEASQLAVAAAARRRDVRERITTQAPTADAEGRVAMAREWVRHNLDRPMSLSKVCEEVVHLDHRHFARVFRATTGMTFGEYVMREKMDEAKYLLVGTDLPVKAVAAAVGFTDPAYFSRAFGDRVGQSPSSFRGSRR